MQNGSNSASFRYFLMVLSITILIAVITSYLAYLVTSSKVSALQHAGFSFYCHSGQNGVLWSHYVKNKTLAFGDTGDAITTAAISGISIFFSGLLTGVSISLLRFMLRKYDYFRISNVILPALVTAPVFLMAGGLLILGLVSTFPGTPTGFSLNIANNSISNSPIGAGYNVSGESRSVALSSVSIVSSVPLNSDSSKLFVTTKTGEELDLLVVQNGSVLNQLLTASQTFLSSKGSIF